VSRFRAFDGVADSILARQAIDDGAAWGKAYRENVNAAATAAARGDRPSANIPTSGGASRGFWDQARQNADKTTAWAKEQAEIAARTFGKGARAVGTGIRNLPGPIKTAGATALGAGTLAAAGATAYGAFNMLSGRAPFDGPDMPGSPEAKDAAARQQAQDQLNRYAQLAQETQLKAGEMAKIADQMRFMGAQDLQQQEARQNMLLGIEQKVLDQNFNEIRRQQPYLAASRFRESMPQMAQTRAAVTQSIINSVGQGYR
jgi:hypothetical protein